MHGCIGLGKLSEPRSGRALSGEADRREAGRAAVAAKAQSSGRTLGGGSRHRPRHIGKEVRDIHENESVYVPIGSEHRLENHGKIPLELIEVQTGSYFGEDDIHPD